MHLICRIIDIQKEGFGRPLVRRHKRLEEAQCHAVELTVARSIFQPTHGGLTGEGFAHSRQAITSCLESRIMPEKVTIVGVFVATAI
jgi:hypothetical protein